MTEITITPQELRQWRTLPGAGEPWWLRCVVRSPLLGQHTDQRLQAPVAEGELYDHPHQVSGSQLEEAEQVVVVGLQLVAGREPVKQWPHIPTAIGHKDAIVYVIRLDVYVNP